MNFKDDPRDLVSLLRARAEEKGDSALYRFLTDGECSESILTYSDLELGAREIAARVRKRAGEGDRALLLYPPGLEFVRAFFGCLYAGVIAVPAYPPRNLRHVPRIKTLAADCEPAVCLSAAAVLPRCREFFSGEAGLEALPCLATDELGKEAGGEFEWERPEDLEGRVAYLQYTSGSTSEPKGVMVTHRNLLHNLRFIFDEWGSGDGARVVSWLPLFHDMGLIYGVLQPLYAGGEGILMAPATFLQKPHRWLQAISRCRAESAIAPNFAYELCARKVSAEDKQELDLSCWTRAHNAAEPVRGGTMERFVEAFETCGFRREAMKPAYGLAEATLAVTYARKGGNWKSRTVDREALGKHLIQVASGGAAAEVVSCGTPARDQLVGIVDPETLTRCEEGVVGEIWVSGPSVAKGYWKRPEETERTFRAFVPGENGGPFLRTGDLGFLRKGELYVTGRLKEMILIRGVNHYPQDIERTLQGAHSDLQVDGGAAFSVELDGEERLVVVQELARHAKADRTEVCAAVQEAVAEAHGLRISDLALVRFNSVPKTSSGKIQRNRARAIFLAGGFNRLNPENADGDGARSMGALGEGGRAGRGERGIDWLRDFAVKRGQDGRAGERGEPEKSARGPVGSKGCVDGRAIRAWMRDWIGRRTGAGTEAVEAGRTFAQLGIDSVTAVGMTSDLAEWLERPLSPTLLWSYPTLDRLADFLAVPEPLKEPAALKVSGELEAFPAVAGLDNLSEADLARVLQRELEKTSRRRVR